MMLKQVIRYTNADALEATWVRLDQMPDVEVPASPALYDKDGTEVQPAVAAHTKPGEIIETVLKCQAYSNDPEQMAMLRADLGADAAQYEELIAEVEATYVPPAPPDPKKVALETIVSLETTAQLVSQRLFREAVLGMMEKEAAELGMTTAQLAAKNKGYRELKAFDQQISTLREKL